MNFTFSFNVDKRTDLSRIVMRAKFRHGYVALYEAVKDATRLHVSLQRKGLTIHDVELDLPEGCTVHKANKMATQAVLDYIATKPYNEDLVAYVLPYAVNADDPPEGFTKCDPPEQNVYVNCERPMDMLYAGRHLTTYANGDIINVNTTAYKIVRVKDIQPATRICYCRKIG